MQNRGKTGGGPRLARRSLEVEPFPVVEIMERAQELERGGKRSVYDRRRKLVVELMRGLGFRFPVLPHGAFYVFADASKFTDDSYEFAFELLEEAGVGVAPGVDFGQAGKRSVRFSYASSEENVREAARCDGSPDHDEEMRNET